MKDIFLLLQEEKMVDTNMFGSNLFILICAIVSVNFNELQCYATGEYEVQIPLLVNKSNGRPCDR